MGAREQLRVRVNDDLVLDAGTCEEVSGADGPERLIRPPETTLFHQVLAYLRAKPDPPVRPGGSASGREGVAAAAVVLRWGSYLALLLDCDKPIWAAAARPDGTSRISDEEMARINIEASAPNGSTSIEQATPGASMRPWSTARSVAGQVHQPVVVLEHRRR